MNALEIVKMTPRTNCGECGYAACMAFAVAVVSAGEDLAKCPYIEVEDAGKGGVQHVHDPDTVLLKTLKQKVESIDIRKRAGLLGGSVVEQDGRDALSISYLGESVVISATSVVSSSGAELDPRDQILLYNYLFFGGDGELSGKFVGLEGELRKMNAELVPECHADFCMVVPVLPKVPIQVHFWDAEPDDGFPASVKVLFDSNALNFLDIESLIFAAERMTEKACGQE